MFPIQKVYSGDITTTSMFIKNFAERFKYHQQSGKIQQWFWGQRDPVFWTLASFIWEKSEAWIKNRELGVNSNNQVGLPDST